MNRPTYRTGGHTARRTTAQRAAHTRKALARLVRRPLRQAA